MFVHSIPEGLAIGVGYATGDLRFGLLLGDRDCRILRSTATRRLFVAALICTA